jgi:hypothetical protein
MADKQELQVQQKRELEKKEEATVPARVFGRVGPGNFTPSLSQIRT